jgi:hypothetical protein
MSHGRAGFHFQGRRRVPGASYRMETMIPVGDNHGGSIFRQEEPDRRMLSSVPQRERAVKGGHRSVSNAP